MRPGRDADVRRLGPTGLEGAPRAALPALAGRARGRIRRATSVRQDYRERVQLLIDAITLKKPARVPVSANVGFYVGKYSGLTKKEAMYDYQKSAAALIKYHEDFRPDFQARPVAPAKVFELLGLQFVDWPGHGLAGRDPLAVPRGRVHEAGRVRRPHRRSRGLLPARSAASLRIGVRSSGRAGSLLGPDGSREHALQHPALRQSGGGRRRAAAGRGRPRVLRLAEGDGSGGCRRGGSSGHTRPRWGARPRPPTTCWPTRFAAPRAS